MNTIRLMIFMMLLELQTNKLYAQDFRPKFHFSPKVHWMNDPNGMIYHEGVYHLFYQYYPNDIKWGPMHWAHATSKDLFTWQEKAIALYPDSLGMIFSGSAVVDENNTAGFGKNALVAIFTHHNAEIEKAKTGFYEYQSLAYSTDNGETWTKYKGNPVLPNPGITDFRDPKVMWFEKDKKWIMTLATKDRVTFYSSADLKSWKKESDFGSNLGAHGGVWECPDLFPLEVNGQTKWVLMVSINPGGPNGGSATQYFTGSFNGKTFSPDSNKQKWVDYGTDNYAGVTWSNTGKRKIFIGWMNNWQYADLVPTKEWRGAATLPRELGLTKVEGEFYLTSNPVKEMAGLIKPLAVKKTLSTEKVLNLSETVKSLKGCFKLSLTFDASESFTINLGNNKGEKLIVGYDVKLGNYFIDRTKAGISGFEKGFARKHIAPRISKSKTGKISLILDAASLELFADEGITSMTDTFFPTSPINKLEIIKGGNKPVTDIAISGISLNK
ncbi:glycoside hydrolase family 32 protein [Pedobacter jejuensis]|uniref:Glycoside hydrolase family 32 protein n=1 Tax=Pedobacter jejuensis TaxID=1268550 RepID=A0A3N0BN48_9SPHI|nr:glycoside hydrolase family 32 protein [Pedobacter jejuensis]RNL50152.1 glycoside hydrolase family 32 protein [Pedobacter jejuensis]